MRKFGARTAAAALAGILAAGMLTGCGEEKLNGAATAATVDGEAIPMGLVSLIARQQQAQTELMYNSFMGGQTSAIWDTEAEEGKTYGELTVEESLKQAETMYLLKAKAPEYQVEISEEETKAMKEAADSFMGANTEETIEALGVTEEQVQSFLELRTYQDKMYDAIVAEADTNVSQEEAQQSGFTYICVSTAGEEVTEEDKAKKKEDAQTILDKLKEDPSADMDTIAQEVDENYNAIEGTFQTKEPEEGEDTSTYPEEVMKVLRELKEGEISEELIEAENGFYIVRLDKELDEEATESKKESIIAARKTDLYNETTEKWLDEAEIKADDKVMKTLEITDAHSFTIQMPEPEVTEAPKVTEAPAEDEETAEVTEVPEATEAPAEDEETTEE